MKIKLYAVPLIIIGCCIQCWAAQPAPAKPVKALTRDGNPIEAIDNQPKPIIPKKDPFLESMNGPTNEKPKPATTIPAHKEKNFEVFMKRLENVRKKVDPEAQQQVKKAVEQNITQLLKKDNYTSSNQNTLAYNIELIDYLQKKGETSSLLIQNNIRELIPLLENLDPNAKPKESQKKMWQATSGLILFSKTLNNISWKIQKQLIDLKYLQQKERSENISKQVELEEEAKKNSFKAILKRQFQKAYSTASDLLSPITNMEYSLLLRVILFPLAYFINGKE